MGSRDEEKLCTIMERKRIKAVKTGITDVDLGNVIDFS